MTKKDIKPGAKIMMPSGLLYEVLDPKHSRGFVKVVYTDPDTGEKIDDTAIAVSSLLTKGQKVEN